MKISIITVVYNGEKYLQDCIESVLNQNYENLEYIIIDGGSTDATLSIIEKYQNQIHHFISEKDKGMYDALNKGINLATGDVIGILNADDKLASNSVITQIANSFVSENVEGVYGNLNYINETDSSRIIRKWVSKPFAKKDIALGWMPAHPTLYLRKRLFDKYGNYSLDYGTAADYELMLRFLYLNEVKAVYLDLLIVEMRIGGMSNSSIYQRYKAMINDYKAIKSNRISFPVRTLLLKKLSKIVQYL
ncbi:MAG: glycosyltransferase [Pedobacter sp.]|nr:MAG: glycosyltransferase [Pedobacter sp.]